MRSMKFGRGPSGAAVYREAMKALPREGRVVVEISDSIYREINRLRGKVARVKIHYGTRPVSFAEAVSLLLRRPW